MDDVKKIKFKDIFKTLLSVPKTIRLISSIEKKNLNILLLLTFVIGALPIVSIYIYQELINMISVEDFKLTELVYILTIYFMTSIFSSLLMELYKYVNNKFNLRLGYKINKLLLKKTTKLSLRDFETPETYNIVEKITQESSYKPFQIMNAILGILTSFIAFFSSIIYISIWNYYVALLIIIVPVFSLIIFLKIGQLEFIIRWKRANDERKTWYWIYLLTHDFSFKEVKLNGLSNYILQQFSSLKEKFILQDLKLLRKKITFNILLELVLEFIEFVIIMVGLFALKSGEILLGGFIGIIRALGIVNSRSQNIIQDIYIIYNSSLYMEQLFNFINKNSFDNNYVDTMDILNQKISKLKIKNLNFYYPNGTVGLNDLNIEFKSGELVAIVGKNGSGKTTLVKHICGLYRQDSGDIMYNDIKNNSLPEDFYSKNVSVLFQDFTKYELTLKENIAFGNISEIDNSKYIVNLLNKMKLDFLKDNNNYNLDMQLGNWFNEGRQLSGGQWQKIGLVRALIKPASIYILDEPNAALDSLSEKSVFDTFLEYSKNSIAIFVSHKLSAAKKADRIIVMEKGTVTCEGSHDYLINNNKTYRDLYYAEKYEEGVGYFENGL